MFVSDRTTSDGSIEEEAACATEQMVDHRAGSRGAELCVHELVSARARLSPQTLALASDDCRMSYGELDRRANQLANRLRSAGVGPEVLVGLCLERSPALGMASLGILKAGGAYLSLDSSYPDERIAFMMSDSRARILVTQASLMSRLGQMAELTIVIDDDGGLDSEPPIAPPSTVSPRNLAYVLYTSGSTGTPK